jgi:dihydrofolate reductase
MSLDGFISGPDDSMEWIFENIPADGFPEITATTGAALVGRRTYDVGRRDAGKDNSEFHGGTSSAPIFVLTHEPPAEGDPYVTFVTSDVASAVATALEAADGRNLEILGTRLTDQCLELGLVEEILIHVHPTLLRTGTRLTNAVEGRLTKLEPISTTVTGRITSLRFRVAT